VRTCDGSAQLGFASSRASVRIASHAQEVSTEFGWERRAAWDSRGAIEVTGWATGGHMGVPA